MIRGVEVHTGEKAELVRTAIHAQKYAADHFPGTPLLTGMVKDFPGSSALDANLHMNVLDAQGTYDFVMTVSCLDFFDLNEILPKVRSLLNPFGLFYGQLGYWWFPVNATGIVAHFPYAAQRLSLDDLGRYCTQYQPEFLPSLKQRYNYHHQGKHHPTLTDWFALARKHGLKPIAFERVMPKAHQRIRDCPPAMFKQPWFDHGEVLRDIHHLKLDVTVEDLFTGGFRVVFMAA